MTLLIFSACLFAEREIVESVAGMTKRSDVHAGGGDSSLLVTFMACSSDADGICRMFVRPIRLKTGSEIWSNSPKLKEKIILELDLRFLSVMS